ncbi:TPA: hypothetical protein ACF39K_004592 [Vibrio parahaemolyticus]|uniref:hypothetical protein n=1 Tax=Vibrio parahaemolyticus TaxID=670 RepID=UPI001A908170|nr:hypothetical protein [Vibrio parahaemolyticus]MBO0160052.1 hypothetical protein [Vibrio parahaemolyticus]MBO0175248.1 hypothetical protein [Vibrio parahaemolyticus]MEA5286016.1 hypothetical protein [Vibrio parahaemolyticus]HCE1578202.1 hypothetical protein [Vibrio parahaemolyticus]HCG5291736.1 hypothetical protein [Vibrio parahaemolyticus]
MVLSLSVFHASASEDSNKPIDKAIGFLEKACVTKGSSLEINAELDGTFKIKNIKNAGVSGSVTLTQTELEGFADAASELSASQANAMRKCMQPHIDKILSVILTSHSEFDNQEITIETKGTYFVVEDLDKVMLQFSLRPYFFIKPIEAIKYVNIHPAKVRASLRIAQNNEFIEYLTNDNGSGFVITDKGINYVLQKGLVE